MAPQNQYITMSAAATIHPIVLRSDRCQGNLYLAGKKTFLEFYTDEHKVLKGAACARSASADSYFYSVERSQSTATTATPTNRSSSPSSLSSINENKDRSPSKEYDGKDVHVTQSCELQSPGASPRGCHEANYPAMNPIKKSISWADVRHSAGYPMMMATPEMIPRPTSYVNEANQNGTSPMSQMKKTLSWADVTEADIMPQQCITETNGPLAPIKKSISWADVTEAEEYPAPPCGNDGNQGCMNPMKRSGTWADFGEADMNQMVMAPCVNDANHVVNYDPMAPIKKSRSWADVKDSVAYPIPMTPEMLAEMNQMMQNQMPPQAQIVKPQVAQKDMQPQQPQVVKPRNKAEPLQNKPMQKQDPKKLNLAAALSTEPITTLMMRGIPCGFSQEAFVQLIDDAGLKGKYNFFYLPRDGNRGSNLGYAFLNFVDQPSAEQCTATFQGVQLNPARSKKTCTISPADIQGLAALRNHFCRTAVMRASRGRGPVFLKV